MWTYSRIVSHYRRYSYVRSFCNENNNIIVNYLCKHLKTNKTAAEYLCLKNPVVNKLTESRLESLLNTVHYLGYEKTVVIDEPLLLSMHSVSIKFRHKVLEECGFGNITAKHIVSFLTLVKYKSISELKRSGDISDFVNVENRLASYMTQWPTSLTTLVDSDVNRCSLYTLRLKIIERYLELVLDLTKEEFNRGLHSYPTIKHRPLEVINETLGILQSHIMITPEKIKKNLYLIHVDPENLKQLIFNFRSIGGIDMKEILRMHPKLATKNYSTLVEIRKVLQEYNISEEAQRRCFPLYTLSPDTVRERLERAKSIPELNTFLNHPRYLRVIHYNTTAMKRLSKLHDKNKKCLSLNILSGSSMHYEIFEKAPGDRLGKGKDLLFCISECLGKSYSMNTVRKTLKRHPFWINIPLIQVKYVYEKLATEFTPNDIYRNCPILLYPWSKIKEVLHSLHNKHSTAAHEHVKFEVLSNSQKLSLVLYHLEKHHYFTGNGVWVAEKNKIVEPQNVKSAITC